MVIAYYLKKKTKITDIYDIAKVFMHSTADIVCQQDLYFPPRRAIWTIVISKLAIARLGHELPCYNSLGRHWPRVV